MKPRHLTMLAMAGLVAWANVVFGSLTEKNGYSCGPCSCSTKQGRLIVECSRRDLVTIPEDIPSTTSELNLSGNRLSRIPPGAFVFIKNLTKLVLSFNAITQLETDSFEGLENSLEFLDINCNMISYSTGYASGAINRLRKLSRLFMATDSCPKEFPDQTLQGLANLKELAITMPNVGSFGNSSASLVSLDTLHLSSNCNKTKAISRDDLAALHQLPLRRLSFRNANLWRIDPNALLPFNGTLRKLDISCNALQNITDLLTGLSGLPLDTLLMDRAVAPFQWLGLDDSMRSALTSMNLSILTMSWNNFLEIDLRQGGPSFDMPHLKYLRLGYNQVLVKVNSIGDLLLALAPLIMRVRVLDLNGLFRFYDSYIKVLNCNGEDLLFADKKQDWENDILRHKPSNQSSLEWLNLALSAFKNGTLTMPPQMTRLYIRDVGQLFSDLKCRELPWQLNGDNNLQHVDVSYSTVPHVDCIVEGLGQLNMLDADEIGIISWGPNFFLNMSAPLLKYLNLHGNKLGNFLGTARAWAPFNGTSSVTHLDLSSNGIIRLPTDVLMHSPSLTVLNLSMNRISLWDTSVRYLKKLETLDLSNNAIKSVSPASVAEFVTMRRYYEKFTIDMADTDLDCYLCINEDFFAWYLEDPLAVVNLTCFDGKHRTPVSPHTVTVLRWQCLYVKILLAVISSATFLSVVASVCQSFKWSIKYLYYKARSRLFGLDGRLTLAPIEVYLSYPDAESAKAAQTRMLLTKMGVKNVVTRELLSPGGSEYEQIALHVDSSMAVVMLLSPSTMADSLSDFEFHMALQKGVSQIVLILTTEDLAISKMPKTLRKLLNVNNYLTWPALEESSIENEDTILSHRFTKFHVILEALITNIINRTLPIRHLPLRTTESDADICESDRCNGDSLSASLQCLLGR